MDRTHGADNVDIGGGRRGFRDQNMAAGLVGTEVNAAHMNAVQEEIMAVIEDPELDPPILPAAGNWTQLREAIRRMIDEVRVLQPIFPHVLTVDGKFSITGPSPGTIRIAAGTEWVMRGGRKYVSAETDLATSASKVYHLRWVNGAFGLYDLSALSYNPAALTESDAYFDSTYDDMLVARVTTTAGNVATITPLINLAVLKKQVRMETGLPSSLDWSALPDSGVTLDWARTPDWAEAMWQGFRSFLEGPNGATHSVSAGILRALEIRKTTVTRYAVGNLEYWYEDDALNSGWLAFIWQISAD